MLKQSDLLKSILEQILLFSQFSTTVLTLSNTTLFYSGMRALLKFPINQMFSQALPLPIQAEAEIFKATMHSSRTNRMCYLFLLNNLPQQPSQHACSGSKIFYSIFIMGGEPTIKNNNTYKTKSQKQLPKCWLSYHKFIWHFPLLMKPDLYGCWGAWHKNVTPFLWKVRVSFEK